MEVKAIKDSLLQFWKKKKNQHPTQLIFITCFQWCDAWQQSIRSFSIAGITKSAPCRLAPVYFSGNVLQSAEFWEVSSLSTVHLTYQTRIIIFCSSSAQILKKNKKTSVVFLGTAVIILGPFLRPPESSLCQLTLTNTLLKKTSIQGSLCCRWPPSKPDLIFSEPQPQTEAGLLAESERP